MKKQVLCLFILFCTVPAFSAGVTFNDDGSVTYTSPDGKKRRVSMEGKTPYGITIEGKRRILRRRNFCIEIIYDAGKSDDLFDGVIKKFYLDLEKELRRYIYAHRMGRQRMKVVISNCRFTRTGYCRRNNLEDITLFVFRDRKKIRTLKVDRTDILTTKKRFHLIKNITNKIMKK